MNQIQSAGHAPHANLWGSRIISVTIDAAGIDALLADPDVVAVSVDAPVASTGAIFTVDGTSSNHLAATLGGQALVLGGRRVTGARAGVAIVGDRLVWGDTLVLMRQVND